MKIIFMGTPDFSVGTLEALIAAQHEVVLVVTQPDKPKGRGKQMQYTPVKECALTHNIPVYQPIKIRQQECVDYLRTFDADIMVVIAFGQILPTSILEMTPHGAVNVHASLLPKYRGAAPIQWAILDGEDMTGVTTMQMNEGLDTGDMLEKVNVEITPEETGGTLHDKLAQVGAQLCVQTLEGLLKNSITPKPQGDTTTSYAKMLTKELGRIDWNKPAVEIERLIRGLNPWPSAYTNWEEKIMKIWSVQCHVGNESNQAPGTVISCDKQSFCVQTGNGMIEVLELQLPGKKRMDAGSFLRGNGIKTGELLY